MERKGYSIISILGIEGKKVDILPTNKGMNLTELYSKKGDYLGCLVFDNRKGWKRFVLADLHKDMQMSLDCIQEAFKLTEEYWKQKYGGYYMRYANDK